MWASYMAAISALSVGGSNDIVSPEPILINNNQWRYHSNDCSAPNLHDEYGRKWVLIAHLPHSQWKWVSGGGGCPCYSQFSVLSGGNLWQLGLNINTNLQWQWVLRARCIVSISAFSAVAIMRTCCAVLLWWAMRDDEQRGQVSWCICYMNCPKFEMIHW